MYSHTELRTLLLIVLLGIAAPAAAQDKVTVPLSDPNRPAVVKLGLFHGAITVKGYDGKEVLVEASLRPAAAEAGHDGMKRVPIAVTGLSAGEENNTVNIGASQSLGHIVDVSLAVPRKTSLHLSSVSDGGISVDGVEGEFDVSAGAVTLTNVSGYAVAHAFSGKLLVVFDRINPEKPMAFSSFSGDVDVTFPPDLKANVSFTSDRGDVFSDFEVLHTAPAVSSTPTGKRQGGKYRVGFDKSVRGTINGGGQQIQFTNYSGAIFIRKGR